MRRQPFPRIAPIVLLALDLILTQFSLSLALFFRQYIALGLSFSWGFPPNLTIRIIIALVWAFFFSLFSVYTLKRQTSFLVELKALGGALFSSFAVLAISIFLLDYDEFSRLLYIYFVAINTIVLIITHIVMRIVFFLRRDKESRRILIVGTGKLAQETAKALIDRESRYKLYVVGFLKSHENVSLTEIFDKPILGVLNEAFEIVAQYDIDEVIVALPPQLRNQVAGLFRALQDSLIQLHLTPDALDKTVARSSIEEFAGIELLNLHEPRVQILERFAKRTLDVTVALVGLIVLSPLMFVISILIKLTSPGPVLFKQTRVGKNGRPFTFYKFRSMVQNADTAVHREYVRNLIQGDAEKHSNGNQADGVLKMVNDTRITGMGSFLRKTSLDELPQFFNVLKGDMSLVGPRPPIPYEVEEYQEWHKRRLEAIPGITGLWQIKGRSQVTFDEMIQMDIEYIESQSFWLDLKILILTPFAVVSGKGAG